MNVPHTSWSSFPITNHENWPEHGWPPAIWVHGHLRDGVTFTRRDNITAILRDTETFSAERTPEGEPPRIPLDIEGDEHTRYRAILGPAFGPAAAKAIQPQLRGLASDIFPTLFTRRTGNLWSDYAHPYATGVMLAYFGLPASDRDRIDAMVRDKAHRKLLTEYLHTVLPTAAGIVAQLRDHLTDTEMANMVGPCLSTGIENIAKTATFLTLDIAARPQLRQHLHDTPDLTTRYVEDTIRCFPSTTMIPRTVTTNTTIAGINLAPGDALYVFLAAPGREHGPQPLADGKSHPHVTFGAGPHRCLGMHITRAALTALVEELLLGSYTND